MIDEKVKKILEMIDNLLEQVKTPYTYDPEMYREVRKVQVQIILLAKELRNSECRKVLHKAFQELSDAYYIIKWYGKQDKRLVTKVVRCKLKEAKALVSTINSANCG